MAVLNLRGVPDDLAARLKSEAIFADMGFHEYCVLILSNRGSMVRTLGKTGEPRKKIADISVGGESTEGGGDPCLPRGGKAQDEDLSHVISERLAKRIPRTEKELVFLRNMGGRELGDLKGISVEEVDEMKEIAKVDIGVAKVLHVNGVTLDREILVRWGLAENYKPKTEEKRDAEIRGAKGRGTEGQDRGSAGGDSKANPEGDDVAQGGTVATGKPGVNMQALRDICEGKGIRPAPLSAEPVEVDLCGFKAHNEEDGEWYVCTKEKHGPKINHGEWLKV